MALNEFQIAIPSYRRGNVLITHTLPLIESWNVPMERVHVFCVEEEYSDYETILHSTPRYENVAIHVGPLGLHHMRNHITQFFPENAPILHMDDDIKQLYCMTEDMSVPDITSSRRYKLHPMPVHDAMPWIVCAFETARQSGARLWGVYPVRNGYFMKDLPPITYDLRFCVGAFWGIWNDKTITIDIEEKEDFDRTLQVFERTRTITRFNRVCFATNYYSTPGGMQARGVDRLESSKDACKHLIAKWPQYCKLYKGKKSGIWEVRISCRTV